MKIGWFIAVMMLFALPVGAAAPVDYDFTGYRDATLWRILYLGRFAKLVPNDFENFQEPGVGAGRENALKIAIFNYHKAWSSECAATSNEPMVPIQITLESSKYGLLATNEFAIRARYVKLWESLFHELTMPQSVFKLFLPRSAIDPKDLVRLFQEQTCGSDMLKRFEENLHRAQAKRPSIQEESQWPDRAPLFHKGCASVLSKIGVRKPTSTACHCAYGVLSNGLHQEEI